MDTGAKLGAPLYAANGLTRTYGQGEAAIDALTRVSFSIATGSFTAIVGPSGSGKSTLLNILGFLDQPTAGTLQFNGADTAADTPDQLAIRRNRDIGFIFQSYHLLPRSSALDNVCLPLLYSGAPAGERRDRAAAMLNSVGLEHRLDHRPTQLSGGEQQRVAIARALVNQPHVLLADEPTGALDTSTGEDVLDVLKDLNSNGLTLVVVTHSESVAAQARETLTLRDGQLQGLETREPDA